MITNFIVEIDAIKGRSGFGLGATLYLAHFDARVLLESFDSVFVWRLPDVPTGLLLEGLIQ